MMNMKQRSSQVTCRSHDFAVGVNFNGKPPKGFFFDRDFLIDQHAFRAGNSNALSLRLLTNRIEQNPSVALIDSLAATVVISLDLKVNNLDSAAHIGFGRRKIDLPTTSSTLLLLLLPTSSSTLLRRRLLLLHRRRRLLLVRVVRLHWGRRRLLLVLLHQWLMLLQQLASEDCIGMSNVNPGLIVSRKPAVVASCFCLKQTDLHLPGRNNAATSRQLNLSGRTGVATR